MSVTVRAYEFGGSLSLIEHALHQSHCQVVASACVCVGDVIDTDDQDGFLRGHGTYVVDGKLVATVCGVVERVNKLIYVKPLKNRYSAQQGDVVVGRVREVIGKRWKVDLASKQEASLLLSAVNLPGGVQRRRNAEDELNMRSVFKEGDLISAEVQQLHGDGTVALHTRSTKYGKLDAGQLLVVPPTLVRRQKQHFHSLEDIGVDLILGINGWLWIAPHVAKDDDGRPLPDAVVSAEARENVCRVANAIRALAGLHLAIYPATIMDAYEIAESHGLALKDMQGAEYLTLVIQSEAVRRDNEAK